MEDLGRSKVKLAAPIRSVISVTQPAQLTLQSILLFHRPRSVPLGSDTLLADAGGGVKTLLVLIRWPFQAAAPGVAPVFLVLYADDCNLLLEQRPAGASRAHQT